MANNNRKISLAITTYNSSGFILDALKYAIDDSRVNEIINHDDFSHDYEQLKTKIQNISKKIKISRNKKNLGAFINKGIAISKCNNQRAILLDSDNFLSKNYINKLFEIDEWKANVIYCPDFAMPLFNYKEFSRKIINQENISTLLNENTYLNVLLNTGNFFVDTQKYIKCCHGHNINGVDVLYFNYLWIHNSNILYIVPGLEYNHRTGHISNYTRSQVRAKKICKRIINALIKNQNYKYEYEKDTLFEKIEQLILIKKRTARKYFIKIPFLINLYKFFKKIILFLNFIVDFLKFKKLSRKNKNRFPILWRDRYPCLFDSTKTTTFSREYVYHVAWASRILAKTKPNTHIDIASSLYFCSIVSAFINIKFYDYRPADLKLSNLSSGSADLLHLPFEDGSIQSISCMHTIEHIGLGRYGDSLDVEGDLKAISELKRVLSTGGNLLFVVPIGKSKIMFNAHRIYSYEQIIDYFSELKLEEFVLIPDNHKDGGLVYNPSQELLNKQNNGCGCFWFKKL